MTAQSITSTIPDDPLDLVLDDIDDARTRIAADALRPDTDHRVGLELEFHLVDHAEPARRPDWPAVQALLAELPPMPSGSSVTLEPGAQIELSTPPRADVGGAVQALAADREELRTALAEAGFGAAPLGADPARPVRRVNPHPRYAAMEGHFSAIGCAGPGLEMMTATAALQVNVDAGPVAGWPDRLALIRSLVPVLVATSASSPYLAGRSSGWHSMRQETWYGIDHGRTDPITAGAPPERWADYALAAPVMLVRDASVLTPVTRRVSFGEWVADPRAIGRPATVADLDYHLTTLFPPVRPRGYVEIRCLDALPDRWWPALAALTVTLLDDPVAADAAAELCEPVAGSLDEAARSGLADPALRAAAAACAEVAAAHCPPSLKADVERLAELLAAGRTPGDELRHVAETRGPLHLLEEEARA
ncbi:glutamate--cysteine ligase [Nocardioides ginsengisegetis]|uniref:Glutamate--cysteine ligase EgtA n=1 Tax=Nocardioides ginsengisegetis TaxID=661491 RepID=A0A7W3J0E6_9ACTN|nr:ergothioneine biosynthesis glutamate--cysteine ligase EgtA [Nocardioides ginsengisegetis]MBA8803814.1 glutamate--cysteine ligase [Nocardioides ginsengisegetis]